jgi:hypothetical protein
MLNIVKKILDDEPQLNKGQQNNHSKQEQDIIKESRPVLQYCTQHKVPVFTFLSILEKAS